MRLPLRITEASSTGLLYTVKDADNVIVFQRRYDDDTPMPILEDMVRIVDRTNASAALLTAAKEVEAWWVRDKVGETLGGAPVGIFMLRAAIEAAEPGGGGKGE